MYLSSLVLSVSLLPNAGTLPLAVTSQYPEVNTHKLCLLFFQINIRKNLSIWLIWPVFFFPPKLSQLDPLTRLHGFLTLLHLQDLTHKTVQSFLSDRSQNLFLLQSMILIILLSFTEFDDLPLTVGKTDMATIVKVMQLPDSGLEIRDRMWLKITIANAVIGKMCFCVHHLWKDLTQVITVDDI